MKIIRRRLTYFVACFSLVASLTIATPAHAFLGAEDIVFDPQSYAELTAVWNQLVSLWNTAKSTLQTLETVQNTIEKAQEGYEMLKNFDLQKAAKDLFSGNLNGSKNKFGAARALMNNFEGKLSSNVNFVGYQMQKIGDLKNIDTLLNQSAKNLDTASGHTRQEANTKITAQSTATIATLLAAEHQRKIQQDMAAAKDVQDRQDMSSGQATIFDAVVKAEDNAN